MILHVVDNNALSLSVCEVINIGAEKYDGPYEWTPSTEAQTVQISGKQATADIVIQPIPNNYGLVTYNGSTITVS